jgi:hypothetical protein
MPAIGNKKGRGRLLRLGAAHNRPIPHKADYSGINELVSEQVCRLLVGLHCAFAEAGAK